MACRICKKPSHTYCVDAIRVPRGSFKCSRVTYFLGKGGALMKDPERAPSKPPIQKKQRCLVCGDDVTETSVWHCTLKCEFKAHDKCVSFLADVLDKNLTKDTFCCSDVSYQFRPDEVENDVMPGSIAVKAWRSKLLARGSVNTAKYSVKTKRWVNEEVNCRFCHRWYGLNEADHHSTYCKAISGTPVPRRETPYLLSRCKRFRHISWKTP